MSIFTPGMGDLEGEEMVQSTRRGSPFGSAEIFVPEAEDSASWVWKGPSKLPSVEWGGLGWSIASTRSDNPRISDRRMNSYLLYLQINWVF